MSSRDDCGEAAGCVDDDPADLYENAPCGYVTTQMDGTVVKINSTLLGWLDSERDRVVGKLRFTDLLSVGGKIYYETHFSPLLQMQGEVRTIALELVVPDGTRLPVMVTSNVKTDPQGVPLLIRTTLFDARDRRAYEEELLRARQVAEYERSRAEVLASTLQRSLLPPALPNVPGLDVEAYYHFASRDEVGGDFYDLFPLGDQRWGFFLGDVCGKGADAAAFTSLTRYTLRAAAVNSDDPIDVLRTLNTVLYGEQAATRQTASRFCTAIFGTVSTTAEGIFVEMAAGGHPPALLLGRDGGAEYVETPGGQLIGMIASPRFVATSVRLRPGETLLLYTDGITEARFETHGRFDDNGALQAFASAHSAANVSEILEEFRGLLSALGDGVEDDVALLAIGCPKVTTPPV